MVTKAILFFFSSDFHCYAYIDDAFERFNLDFLSWLTTCEQVSASKIIVNIVS